MTVIVLLKPDQGINLKYVLFFIVTFVFTVPAYAAPSKKSAQAFIRELETTVKAGDMAIQAGTNQALHDHSKRTQLLKNKAAALFVPAEPSGACDFAASSANQLWTQRVQQFQRPTEAGHRFIKRALEDYQDNLKLCKMSLGGLK